MLLQCENVKSFFQIHDNILNISFIVQNIQFVDVTFGSGKLHRAFSLFSDILLTKGLFEKI